MKNIIYLLVIAGVLVSCNEGSKKQKTAASGQVGPEVAVVMPDSLPSIPAEYKKYFESEDSVLVIGNDGNGMSPISDKTEYYVLPDKLKGNAFADSLAQLNNINLAFNTFMYDCSTVDRFYSLDSLPVPKEFMEAIRHPNFSGVENPKLKSVLIHISKRCADQLAAGVSAQDIEVPEYEEFFKIVDPIAKSFFGRIPEGTQVDCAAILPGYEELHAKVAKGTSASVKWELINRYNAESDFQKKCVLAQEFAYANHVGECDEYQVIGMIDPLLKTGEYSPLLGRLWKMWRAKMQSALGGISNYSAMYNLLYNSVRNKVVDQYVRHLAANPDDFVSLKEYLEVSLAPLIYRNSECVFGNNAMLDEFNLYGFLDEDEENQ